jgi:hypothetical protein
LEEEEDVEELVGVQLELVLDEEDMLSQLQWQSS